MTDTQKNDPTPEIAAAHYRWKRARDFIAGEDAVKAADYLPQQHGQSPAEYRKMVERTTFYAGAARTHECMIGLVTRKPASFQAPDNLKEGLFRMVTVDGRDVNDLAEDGFSENLEVGLWGMLVDHPVPDPSLRSVKAVEAAKITPRIATYKAEQILEITDGVVANRLQTVRVRLLEKGGKAVRELFLDDGVYRFIMWREIDGQWVPDPVQTPLRGGAPLDKIPFFHVDPKGGVYKLLAGPLDHVIRSNVQHFKEECNAATSRFWCANPVPYVLGAKRDPNLVFSPGTLLWFEDSSPEKPVTLGMLEWSGNGYNALLQACNDRKDEMAKLGSNILASEKSAVEAAETHAIRRSSENSVLAGLARATSRKIEEALRCMAWWHGKDEKEVEQIKFELNTDFVPSPMTSQDMAACLALWQGGAISRDELWTMLQAGEVLRDTLDREVMAAEIDNETAKLDRPTSQPVLEPAE